jgi:two-component system, OmpR family, response regulator
MSMNFYTKWNNIFQNFYDLNHIASLVMAAQKVVIIDDEEDLCHLLKTYLSSLNYEVHIALSISEGMRLIRSVAPDIIFLDNNLPDGLGWEKISLLQAAYPQCKINLISAFDHDPRYINHLEGVRVLEKPIRLHSLHEYL